MPPSVNKSNYKHYKKSPALTEYVELEGRDHWTCAAPGLGGRRRPGPRLVAGPRPARRPAGRVLTTAGGSGHQPGSTEHHRVSQPASASWSSTKRSRGTVTTRPDAGS